MRLVFLHGLESGPQGTKGRILRAAYPELIAPDCTGVHDIEARLAMIERALAEEGELVLVGSSFGGLAAILFAWRHPRRVRALVLCAPAVHWPGASEIGGLPDRVVIIHGRQDEVVPLAAVEAFARRFPQARLIVVDDDHRLKGAQDLLLEEVADALL